LLQDNGIKAFSALFALPQKYNAWQAVKCGARRYLIIASQNYQKSISKVNKIRHKVLFLCFHRKHAETTGT